MKSEIRCNNMPRDRESAVDKIVNYRKEIFLKFEKHKDELHDETDPDGLDDISYVFDIRNWEIDPDMMDRDDVTALKEDLCRCLQNTFDESDLLIGVDIGTLKTEISLAVDALSRNDGMLFKLAVAKDHIKDQWCGITNIPSITNCKVLKKTAQRVALMPNSEAGCEQSNSKYNRTKNKLGSRMELDMIKARMRAGSNGPPLHLFNPKPIREYWIQNRHKVAEMTKSRSSHDSKVIKRIRKKPEEKYTSKMFL